MHELGVLREIVRIVDRVVKENGIRKVKHITLEVGEASGFVPMYLTKLFPVATDAYPAMHETKLIIDLVPDKGLVVKDIGY